MGNKPKQTENYKALSDEPVAIMRLPYDSNYFIVTIVVCEFEFGYSKLCGLPKIMKNAFFTIWDCQKHNLIV